MKKLIFDNEHPNGCLVDISEDETTDNVTSEPTTEDRLQALEAAMLDMIMGG